ncbi:MAG: hypothetical protein WC781_05520 [Candidatus Pacearchaeota archaeon]|jgi:hypothetical protein
MIKDKLKGIEKTQFQETKIYAEIHYLPKDKQTKIENSDGVKILSIKQKAEFGFEDEKKLINIEIGFGCIKIQKDVFEEQIRRLHNRRTILARVGIK